MRAEGKGAVDTKRRPHGHVFQIELSAQDTAKIFKNPYLCMIRKSLTPGSRQQKEDWQRKAIQRIEPEKHNHSTKRGLDKRKQLSRQFRNKTISGTRRKAVVMEILNDDTQGGQSR